MSRNSLFENMRTGFSSLEILQEPASHEYQLKMWDLKYFETILTVDGKKNTFCDSWRLIFRLFDGWRLTPAIEILF